MTSETLTTTPGNGSDPAEPERVDVLIVGAGISGIGAAHHLQERCPGKTYAILEAREAIGGTWDLFRYPGIRSDSDMHTLGYRFRPWTAAKSIADGESILEYVRETAREAGIDRKVHFGHRVVKASWSSEEARWTVTAARADGGEARFSCAFLMMCSGYYRYDEGFTPEFEGIEDFQGRVIHPQHWPEEPDYAGKRVVVIGSGATAVTLVPAMAEDAAHVTMLQRSPTYILSVPGEDPIAELLRKFLPHRAVYPIVRWKNVVIQSLIFRLSRSRPGFVKKLIRKGTINALPAGYDVDTHFKPSYNPWDQRLCLVPDADLFKALSRGDADIVTDHIERFTASGIELRSGRELDADVVVTATGLNLLFFGGMKMEIDGVEPDQSHLLAYKGMMMGEVPNLAFTVGYTNASWTLKADLVAEYMCRLLNHMDANGYDVCMPHLTDPNVTEEPILDFSSGYVVRAVADLPKQGSKEPWKLRQNYAVDLRTLRYGSLEDGAMTFSRRVPTPRPVPA
ncbi:MAG: NAD(P)/FAD-dependent oxidoreductase [Actinobacteria bacterium]|nr:NAD(P)/FAD-dependent oxidoreductase [Actinomycetota bacterium]